MEALALLGICKAAAASLGPSKKLQDAAEDPRPRKWFGVAAVTSLLAAHRPPLAQPFSPRWSQSVEPKMVLLLER